MLSYPIPTTMNSRCLSKYFLPPSSLPSSLPLFNESTYCHQSNLFFVLFVKNNLHPKQKIHYCPWHAKTAVLKHPDNRSHLRWESRIRDQWDPCQSISQQPATEKHMLHAVVSPSASTLQMTKAKTAKIFTS